MAKTINTTAINAAVNAALKHAAAYGASVSTLASLLDGVPREQAQEIITAPIGKFYGVAVTAGERGATFDKAAASYEAAKKARTRLLAAVYGATGSSAHKAPAVQRFDSKRVATIQGALAGLTKAQAKAYLAKALDGLSFE